MKKAVGIFVIAWIGLFLFPFQVLAVDFTINETKMDAYVQENGEVHVVETYAYEFDGEFNGITRSLIPKEGSSIIDFKAMENGTVLEVEQEDEEYRIYRSGEDETVFFKLSYVIENGVHLYEDMAEFYWPFFDTSNETDYDNLTIAIHPPEATGDVIAIGYDEAYRTEKIQNDGVVLFEMGHTENGEKGDVRVAYPQNIFPGAQVTHKGEIRDKLLQDKQELAEKEEAYLARQEKLKNIAPYIVGTFGVVLLLFLYYAWRKRQLTFLETERLYYSTSMVPKETMSMPAIIFYLRNQMVEYGEMLTIGMMDLVKQGKIEAKDEVTYHLVDNETNVKHEAKILYLLFDVIGENNLFSFEILKNYTKDSKNQQTLQSELVKYRKMLGEEIKSHYLNDSKVKLRLFTGIIALLLLPFVIFLGIHELYMWVFISLMVMVGLLLFTVFYNPKTVSGQLLKKEWQQFKEGFSTIQSDNWHALPEDDKERALLFSTGLKDKALIEKSKSLIEQDVFSKDNTSHQLLLLLTFFTLANTSFDSATQTFASSGGTSPGGGTGVGGGGGGSGAF